MGDSRASFRAVGDAAAVHSVAALARAIWWEYYPPLIGEAQVRHMLDVLQSAAGIRRHMAAGAHYYVVEVSAQAVGYLAWECRGSELFLSKLYLLLAYRGRGLGREALDFVSDLGRSRGCERLSLTVNRRNAPSIAAYRACGFSVVGAVRIDIGGGFFMDDWRLEKQLRRGPVG